VRMRRLELLRVAPPDPKSGAYAISPHPQSFLQLQFAKSTKIQ